MSVARSQPERDDVHLPLVARLRVAGLFFLHVPNESMMPAQRRAMLARMGLLTGAPDLLIFTPPPVGGYRGVALELKAKGGKATAAQLGVLGQFSATGWVCGVSDSLQDAVDWLRDLGYVIPEIGGV